MRDLRSRFDVREVRYDPYQMAAVSQRLSVAGLPMAEFAQTVPNLTSASQNLYELVKSRGLIVYRDADLRLAISRAVAIESSRGWRISKEKASHKIDVVVALAMACLAPVKQGEAGWLRSGWGCEGGIIFWADEDDQRGHLHLRHDEHDTTMERHADGSHSIRGSEGSIAHQRTHFRSRGFTSKRTTQAMTAAGDICRI